MKVGETYTCDKRTRIQMGGGATYHFTRQYPLATCWLTGRPSYNQGTLQPILLRMDAKGILDRKLGARPIDSLCPCSHDDRPIPRVSSPRNATSSSGCTRAIGMTAWGPIGDDPRFLTSKRGWHWHNPSKSGSEWAATTIADWGDNPQTLTGQGQMTAAQLERRKLYHL